MLRRCLFLLVLALAVTDAARALEAGVFPARTWDIRQIKLGDDYPDPPFYSLTQSQSGLIYAGDRSGVLEFDGRNWRRYPVSIQSAVTVLGVTRAGSLVIGGAETLLVVANPNKPSDYVDAAKALPEGLLGSGEFWEFAEDQDQWCVRSTVTLVCHGASGFQTYQAPREFGRMFQAGNSILIQVMGAGLCRVTASGPAPIEGGEAFASLGVSTLVETSRGDYAAVVKRPLAVWQWQAHSIPEHSHPVDANAFSLPVGIGVAVTHDRIALPETNGGVAIITTEGELVDRIEPEDLGVALGAQALLVDREGALWIAWRSAISRVEYASRLRVFPLPSTLFGQSLPLTRTSMGITSFHGGTVIVLRPSDQSNYWQFQQHAQMSSSILMIHSIRGFDIVGTTRGIGALTGDAHAIEDELVFAVTPALGSSTDVWVGTRYGVSKLRNERNRWMEMERNSSVTFDAISILQTDPRTLWIGSSVGRVGRVRLAVDSSLAGSEVKEFDQSSGLPKGLILLEQVGDEVFFWVRGGQFYEHRGDKFVPSERVPFEETGVITEVKRIDDAQLLMSSPNSRLRLLRRDITGVYRHQPSVFDEIASVEKIRSIHVDPDGIVWLAQDSNVVRFDPKMEVPKPTPQHVLIRDVSVADRSLISGIGEPDALRLDAGASMRVEYTLPSYRAPELNRFRSRISTASAPSEWSNWSNETHRDFTNLPAGELLFEVEAQDAAGVSGGVASVAITVIAPWYQRSWAIVAFILGGVVVIVFGVQWRLRALRARGDELERLVASKTRALQLAANTDPLTGLWNRHRFGQWLRNEVIELNAKATIAAVTDPADVIVCVIDLDHFKLVNDRHGHAAGDLVLKAVAERMQAFQRPDDLVFRFGGEEFVFLATHRHRNEGKQLAESIVHEISQINVELEGGVLLDPTASVGWSVYPLYRERADLFSLDFVLGIADRALYLAKQDGRNCARGYLPNLPVDEIDRTQADWRTQAFNRHPDFLKRV